MIRRTVAAFDFDGTITTQDTFVPFLERAFGKTPVRLAFMSLFWEGVKVGLSLSTRDRFKELIVGKLFLNESTERLKRVGQEHAKATAAWYRPGALERIRWHREQGHRLVMVSASLDLYLQPDRKSGSAGMPRPISLLGSLQGYELYAYGDSAGDTEMLNAAQHPSFKPFLVATS